jgi:hypothetical protein
VVEVAGVHEPVTEALSTLAPQLRAALCQYIFKELVPVGARSRQTPGILPLKPEDRGEFLFLAPGWEKKARPDPPLNDENNPWLGLQAYGRKDELPLFGRERVVQEILGRLLDGTGIEALSLRSYLPTLVSFMRVHPELSSDAMV